jgi:gamma-glutamylcyclotransferase (GGCT)/AIG2-like uncharacterized protein YtfP
VLPVFVYGTLRPGSRNHEPMLRPWLAGPCRPATLPGHALHEFDGLPFVVARHDGEVVGELADLEPALAEDALAVLDAFEGVEDGWYGRAEVAVAGGERAWAWVAGERVAPCLGPDTRVDHGDWLRVLS